MHLHGTVDNNDDSLSLKFILVQMERHVIMTIPYIQNL